METTTMNERVLTVVKPEFPIYFKKGFFGGKMVSTIVLLDDPFNCPFNCLENYRVFEYSSKYIKKPGTLRWIDTEPETSSVVALDLIGCKVLSKIKISDKVYKELVKYWEDEHN